MTNTQRQEVEKAVKQIEFDYVSEPPKSIKVLFDLAQQVLNGDLLKELEGLRSERSELLDKVGMLENKIREGE